jgi:hypothetical protein
MRQVVVALSLAVILACAATASARRYLGGHEKETIVFGASVFGPGNRNGDRFNAGAYVPTRWETQHCLDAFESTTRFNWAVEYATYFANTHRSCQRVQSNGVAVLKIEHWAFSDGTSGSYWTPVTEFDERACHAGHWPGQPEAPWGVVDDLFGINCAHGGDTERWTLPSVG